MNKKLLISLLVVVVLVVALTAVGFSVYGTKNELSNDQNPNTEDVSDSKDNEDSGRVAAGYVAGHVTIGPNCPGPEIEGRPCPPTPEAYTSRSVAVYESDGSFREKWSLDAEGNYKIALGPGNYFLRIEPAGIGPGEKKSVTIKSFETSTVNFDIDTGIR